MKKGLFLIVCFLCMSSETLLAWDGAGTASDPYLIQTNHDWNTLAYLVSQGEDNSGKTFRLTTNLDVKGMAIGVEGMSFSGIFDGADHTLTFNRIPNGMSDEQKITGLCAPFAYVAAATSASTTSTAARSTARASMESISRMERNT